MLRPIRPKLTQNIQLILAALAFTSCLIMFSENGNGGQVGNERIATIRIGGKDALSVDTTVECAESLAYCKATVTITNPKRKTPADRNFIVVLYLQGWTDGNSGGVSYSAPVTLAENTRSVTVEIPVARGYQQAAWDIGIFEDGRDIENKKLRAKDDIGWSYFFYTESNLSAKSILGSGDDPKSIEAELMHLDGIVEGNKQIATSLGQANRGTLDLFKWSYVRIDSLPTEWWHYLSASFWIVSGQTLEELSQEPEKADALRDYIAAGGTLIVFGAENNEDLVSQFIDKELSWNKLKLPLEFLFSSTNNQSEPVPTELPPNSAQRFADKIKETGYQLGKVLVIGSSLKEAPDGLLIQRLQNLTTDGLPSRTNSDGNWFWANLNRDVGKPPVWIFVGLVGLFGCLIGPGLLYLTGRIGRRSLMLFFVPALSLLATASIVGYGILHEGFEAHVRVTSVTTYDADTGRGFSWSRQNYFSGLPPRQGLVFDDSTYVRDVPPSSSNMYGGGNPRNYVGYSVMLDGDKQAWKNWLNPRTQQQLLIGKPITESKPDFPIEVSTVDPSSREISVKNVSKTEVPYVALRGRGKDHYFSKKLGPGESVELKPITNQEMGFKLTTLMGKLEMLPTPPPEMEDGGQLFDFGANFNSSKNNNASDVVNLIIRKNEYPEFCFVTVVPENNLVPVPLKGKPSKENLHFIMGIKRW